MGDHRVARIFRLARDFTPKPHAHGTVAARIDTSSFYTGNSAAKNQFVNMDVNNLTKQPEFSRFSSFSAFQVTLNGHN